MVKNHESLPTSPASFLVADSGEKKSREKTAAAVDGIREAKALILSLMKVIVPLFQRTMCLRTLRARARERGGCGRGDVSERNQRVRANTDAVRWQLDGKQAGGLGAPVASPGPFVSRPHTGHPDPLRTHFDIGHGQEAASVEAGDEDAAGGWQYELDVLSHEYSRLKTDIEVRAPCVCPAAAHLRTCTRA